MLNDKRKTPKPAYVQQARKAVPFTVLELGGKAELEAWKKDQVRKQAEWEAGKNDRYATARQRAVAILTGESTYTPSQEDKVEMRLNPKPWCPKTESDKAAIEKFCTYPIAEQPKSLIQKTKDWCAKLWKTAFPE